MQAPSLVQDHAVLLLERLLALQVAVPQCIAADTSTADCIAEV